MGKDHIQNYESMWTTELNKYALCELPGNDGWVIFNLGPMAPVIIDTDAEIFEEIIKKLIEAGVRRLSKEEAMGS